nr:unnamed protein product [Callosobruchus analis]
MNDNSSQSDQSSPTLAHLLKRRSYLKGRVTRFTTFVDSFLEDDSSDFSKLKERYAKFQTIWQECDSIQSNIEEFDTDFDENLDARDEFENSYCQVTAKVEDILKKTNLPHGTVATTISNAIPSNFGDYIDVDQASNSSHIPMKSNFMSNVRLPTIDLPKFDGEALDILKNLEITPDNYDIAWDLLNDAYENNTILITQYVQGLFNLPSVKDINGLGNFLNELNKHCRALKSLNQPIEYWDRLLIPMICDKIDNNTRKAWQEKVLISELPTLDEPKSFLNERVKKRGEGKTDSNKTPSDAVGSLPSSTLGTNNAQNLAQSTELPPNTFTHFSKSNLVILSTAIVQIRDATGAYHQCRALLDSGSQSHITTDLANLLNNKVNTIDMSVTGINNAKSNVSTYTSVHIRSLYNHFEVDINCLVISEITGAMPSVSFDKSALAIPTELNLADPDFNISNKIDLLLGADLLLKTGQVNLGKHQPILQNTLLGWIISGEISISSIKQFSTHCNLISNSELNDSLTRFWEIENIDKATILSEDETAAENSFNATHERDDDGRFIVRLPLKISPD